MSERVDQFADGLGQRLATMESMIDAAKSGLNEEAHANSSDLRTHLYSVRDKFEAAKHIARTAESSVNQWLRAKEASDTAVIQSGREEGESLKLERQAASAEDDAEAGIHLAEAAIVNAVIATYEAIDARRAAEQPESS